MMLYGTTFAMPKTFAISAKDFGGISESLSHTNVYTTKRERLYHRKLWFIPQPIITRGALRDKNHVVCNPKLRHLHLKTPIVTTPKPHTCECRTAQPETAAYLCTGFFPCCGDIKLSVIEVLGKVRSRLRQGSSQLRKAPSQKVLLCKCKPTTRNLGKRFGGG